jgi:hypothetical protein
MYIQKKKKREGNTTTVTTTQKAINRSRQPPGKMGKVGEKECAWRGDGLAN